MPTLCLLRHAKATQAFFGQDDFSRRLTVRGRQDAALLAPVLGRLQPDLALVSSAARTVETWDIAAGALNPAPTLLLERDLYLCRAEAMLERIRDVPADVQRLVVVGHNPGIHEAALSIAGPDRGEAMIALRRGFPTCSLAVFKLETGWADLMLGQAQLSLLFTPRSE
jgi:phosphohistidine phosphatase